MHAMTTISMVGPANVGTNDDSSFDLAITSSWFFVSAMVEALEDVVYHESHFIPKIMNDGLSLLAIVFDGGSIGLNGGIAVVEVEVKWSDDGRGGVYLTAKGVGLRVADSHTGNHREDGFTPLETIRRFLGIIGSRSLSSSKGRPLSQRGGLNPFGCAKLTTFAVMCKAYGCEPSVDLFRGFFNLFPGGEWLTFAKRPEKHIPNLMPKVITRIEGWKGQFFFFQDSIVHVGCPKLLSKDNWWDTKYFGDKLLDRIHENPFFQRLGRYPANVRVFLDPILFLAGLKPSWEYGQQRPVICWLINVKRVS
ncbi:hypothetical protein Tco_0427938 [Tanacetum coccineum]